MEKLIIIGNWKMNKTFTESMEFIINFKKAYKKALKVKNNIGLRNNIFAIAPSHCNLSSYFINKVPELKLASQNMSSHEEGAYTGEISAKMLQDLNVNFSIIGHSERRRYHLQHESDSSMNKKIQQAIKYNITPVICVGESAEDHEEGKTKESISRQLKVLLNEVNIDKVIIAYEPIWAIGTGRIPTNEQISKVCGLIKELVNYNIPVLYGGSVNENNILNLTKCDNLNGFLVGNSSLDVEKFIKLISVTK
ncbi:Triosephosphate isomerase [Mycoplasmopsis maculosa]|uniref:Triosephosphate isomerase n=1 Tax=Mycoplasmopsis maculosa TaxID=114885 RepID=A0A449B3P5_9BACT|nr:triose-phosphate isomerase [Mycoplasmopsis maculosa]VEU75210.1 Triosephosphate isomerase [Mycoplasmopsis maculosa]